MKTYYTIFSYEMLVHATKCERHGMVKVGIRATPIFHLFLLLFTNKHALTTPPTMMLQFEVN